MHTDMHIRLATTSSMIMTFILDCILKDTRTSGSLFQNVLIDKARDQLLYARCWWNNDNANETCKYLYIDEDKYNIPVLIPFIVLHMSQLICLGLQKSVYVRPLIATIICGWIVGRLRDDVDLWYTVDMVTIYFLIWQVMFIIIKWELKQLPLLSINLYRGWQCAWWAVASFVAHDAIFRYLSTQIRLCFFCLFAATDIYLCLHHDGPYYQGKFLEELLKTDAEIPFGLYFTWDPDDDESDEEGYRGCIGHGDFYIYNLMLLLILPPLLPIITKTFITIGYITAVLLGVKINGQLDDLNGQLGWPGLPLPVIMISIYAVLLDIFV